MKRIRISCAGLTFTAELFESESAKRIWEACPFEGRASTWGDEVYFPTPLELDEESDARADVRAGELGYWIPGRAFCIFFGPTPASTGEEPRAASPVNVFGRIQGDLSALKQISSGETVRVERLE